jgi:membrane protease subunit HflC
MAKPKFIQHWPIMFLGLLVAGIFSAVLISFEVKETEMAILMRFGAPRTETVDGVTKAKVYGPGLHLKWPYPFETVWSHDNRLQCYELTRGQLEQIQTADDYQIVVTTYVLWQVGDASQFYKRLDTTLEAEKKLDDLVRNSRNSILGRHNLTELINIDPKGVKITEIEEEILADLKGLAMQEYGIKIDYLGIKHLGFPEKVSTKVFARMRAERKRKVDQYRAEGRRDAMKIRTEADRKAEGILATANADATRIRGQADQEAAEHYRIFSRNPELAAFLRKLDSLRQTLAGKTTLVVDTNTPPYDLLLPGATDFGKNAPAPKTQD